MSYKKAGHLLEIGDVLNNGVIVKVEHYTTYSLLQLRTSDTPRIMSMSVHNSTLYLVSGSYHHE